MLEYVDGVDLAEILHRVGPPEIHKTVGYMVQTAAGLQYLHDNKVFHRNVKPGNLLVDRSGTVKVTNLLMAHIVEASYLDGNDDALTKTGEMLGTVDYVAPSKPPTPAPPTNGPTSIRSAARCFICSPAGPLTPVGT